MLSVELRAVKAILDKGEPVDIPAPLFLRIFGLKKIKVIIRQPKAGTALHILLRRLKIKLDDEQTGELTVDQAFSLQVKHSNRVAQICALAILREEHLLRPVFAFFLARYLLKHMEWPRLLQIMELVTIGNGMQDFIDIITLTKYLRITEPMLSPMDQKS